MNKHIIEFLNNLNYKNLIYLQAKILKIKKIDINLLEDEVNLIISNLKILDPYKIIESKGIKIIKSSFKNSSLILRGLYDEKRKIIEIYYLEIENLLNLLSEYKLFYINEKDIIRIILAHEIYHILNLKKEKLNISEIKANIFAQKFLKLKFYPYLLDLLQILNDEPQNLQYLKKYLQEKGF